MPPSPWPDTAAPLAALRPKSIFGTAPVAKLGTATPQSASKKFKNNTFILEIQGYHPSSRAMCF
jgi:hypothetical protein